MMELAGNWFIFLVCIYCAFLQLFLHIQVFLLSFLSGVLMYVFSIVVEVEYL